MFSKRLPVADLASHCRGLRYYLEAGLTLAQAMKHQAKKGPASVRPVATRISARLDEGDDLAEVLPAEATHFPPIYLSISRVAEETGKLPEALRELEEYFTLQQKLWRTFVTQMTWPVIQFFLAVLVMAGLIYILGEWIRDSPISVLGLKGASGAMVFLTIIGGVLALLIGGYWFIAHVVKQGGVVDKFLLGMPYLGGCLEALALSRFSMAMAIMVDAGTPIGDAAALGLEATGNFAYADRAEPTKACIKEGQSLTEALAEQKLFPQDYLDIVETAEMGGREPDVFNRLAQQNYEKATARMTVLTSVAAKLVWLMVAIFIIVLIFNIYGQYINQLNAIG